MALIDRGLLMFDYLQRLGTKDTYKAKYEALRDAIDNALGIDAAPQKHGEWLQIQYGVLVCSECKKQSLYKNYYRDNIPTKFCPHCGAKMDGEVNECP